MYTNMNTMPMTTASFPPSMTTDLGLIYASTCLSRNILHDFGEWLRNLIGGNMKSYADMMDDGMALAKKSLQEKARALGADGIYGVRISTPSITNNAAEIIMYGTAYRYIADRTTASRSNS